MDAVEIVQEEFPSTKPALQIRQSSSTCAQETYAFSTNLRPPPPGEDSKESEKAKNSRLESLKRESLLSPRATPRRSTKEGLIRTFDSSSEEDKLAPLGFEPEGSAVGTPPYERWANSLQDLLTDPEGFSLFYDYLREELCELLLDFWRSCEGFRRMVPTSYRMLAAAKAIYQKFIQNKSSLVLPIRDATRAKIARHHGDQPVDSSLYDEAISEVLAHIKNSHYPKFLKSDIYRNYAENLRESPKEQEKQGSSKFYCGYLPTLPEEKEYGFSEELCEFDEEPSKYASKAKFGKYLNLLSTGKKAGTEDSAGLYLQKTNKGLSAAFYPTNAPVGSINDSESQSLSSDAITDDATSITDSTVTDESSSRCRHGHDRSHGRDCSRSRGGLPLPSHFVPRTQRLPKDRYSLPPDEFAKVLIEKLEKVKQERELQDREAANLAASGITCEVDHAAGEKKKSILEEAIESHREKSKKLPLDVLVSCVYPKDIEVEKPSALTSESATICNSSKSANLSGQSVASVSSKHPKETIHSRDVLKHEQLNVRATDKGLQCDDHKGSMNKDTTSECTNTVSSMHDSGFGLNEIPTSNLDHDRILQWMEQGEKYQFHEDSFRRVRHHHHHSQTSSSSSHPRGGFKSKHGLPHPLEQINQYAPNQPIAQDPLMPPLPQPEAINVIEEAKRRLQETKEEKKRSHHKSSRSRHYKDGSVYTGSSSSCCCSGTDSSSCSRSVMSYDHRCTNSSFGSSNISSIPSSASNIYSDTKSHDSGIGSSRKKGTKEQHHTTITYWLPREPIPYRTSLPGRNITLQQFKNLVANLVAKKGELRFFFKKMTEDQDCCVVYEELKEDDAILPMYEGKIVGKISKMDV